MKKQMITFIMMLVMSISLCSTAFAADSKTKEYQNIKLEAQKFMNDHSSNCLLEDPIELYNLEDKVVALFFKSTQNGYIIININNLTVPEFSTTQNNQFITDKNKKYYYNGPLSYMEKASGTIIDSKSGEKIGNLEHIKSKLKGNTIYGTENIPVVKSSTVKRATQDQIYGTVPNYSYNPTGICGSTASAMLTRYYDIYVDDRFVPSYLESSDGVALTKHLVPYIDGNEPGSYPSELRSGLNNYLYDQGVSKRVTLYYSSINQIISAVSNDTPFTLAIYSHPTYNNHWVLGYGYYDGSSDDYALVNDGWGSVDVWVHLYYAEYMVY